MYDVSGKARSVKALAMNNSGNHAYVLITVSFDD